MLHHDYAWKGVREGLEAIAAVKVRHPEVLLVGFGVKRPREALPYDEFHENLPQERLAWLYSRCPIYLCPSWDEGLGMPPMEAMACGAALVTFDNGGCRDYAKDGETALLASSAPWKTGRSGTGSPARGRPSSPRASIGTARRRGSRTSSGPLADASRAQAEEKIPRHHLGDFVRGPVEHAFDEKGRETVDAGPRDQRKVRRRLIRAHQ